MTDAAITVHEKREIAKQMIQEDDEDEEPSDYDSDADGLMPPSYKIPDSHWMRASIAAQTMKVVSEAADRGEIVREPEPSAPGKSRLSMVGPGGQRTTLSGGGGGRVSTMFGAGGPSGIRQSVRQSMTGSRIMGFSTGGTVGEEFTHRKSLAPWGSQSVMGLMKKAPDMTWDYTKPREDLPIGADVKVELVGDLGTKCVAHLPPKWKEVALEIRSTLYDPDFYDDGTYGPTYIRNCIHNCLTYNRYDGTGGPEGATIRFRPEKSDAHNRGVDHAQKRLDALVKKKHTWITYADLYVLAAYVVIECSGGPIIPISVGRRDSDGKFFEGTNIPRPPNIPGRIPMPEQGIHDEEPELKAIADQMRRIILDRIGLTEQQMVCLINGGHSYGRCHQHISGYAGPWQNNPGRFNNMCAWNLINKQWKLCDKHMVDKSGDLITGLKPRGIRRQYVSDNGDGNIMMLMSDMCLARVPEWRKWTEMYAKDAALFKRDWGLVFKAATELGWEKPRQPQTLGERVKAAITAVPKLTVRDIAEFVCCREETYYK